MKKGELIIFPTQYKPIGEKLRIELTDWNNEKSYSDAISMREYKSIKIIIE